MEPLWGFKVMDKETHGLFNPWKNYVGNNQLGMDFRNSQLEAWLLGALQGAKSPRLFSPPPPRTKV